DGALYVADFYNRIIGHYEVPLTHPGRDRFRGRIWRIVYRGADGAGKPTRPRPDWAKASIAELVDDLASPNLTVRFKATKQLAERGGDEAARRLHDAFAKQSPTFVRMHALWVLERLGRLDDALLKHAATDDDAGVRVHAMKVLSERPRLQGALHDL